MGTKPFLPLLLSGLVFISSLATLHLAAQTAPDRSPPPLQAARAADFVGSVRCAACHDREAAAWKTSQHARAMETASDSTVLGNFDGATFMKDGATTRFLKSDGRFLIETTGPDGKPGTFEVRYTLGLEPLQQYLVELPGGRLQTFGIAWDSRPADSGGQRWFDLYPGQKLPPGDPLHWAGIQQTANFMCIDCHVTDLHKGFDVKANAYRSTWSEAGVGCEACHGPGAAHVANPKVKLAAQFPPRAGNIWGTDPTRRPQVPALGRTTEVETCARCHARRAQISDDVHAGQSFGAGLHGSLLTRGLYHADGQMQDEVYNWGSFLQSRMFAKGVSCSDCHDPHSQKLRAQGNALCEQCHQAARYDTAAHHFHDPASSAGRCTSCHMPTVTYMGVDPRHDHSFRVPRPDLARSLGVPDACATCHKDKPAGWTAAELEKRLGHPPSGFQTFAEAFAAGDRGAPGASAGLAKIANDAAQPAIVRASAIERAAGLDPALPGIDLAQALADPDPLVRRAAAEAAGGGDATRNAAALAALLRDPIRDVRVAAARTLAGPSELRLSDDDRAALRAALDDYVAVQRYNADRGEAHLNLALLEMRRGNGLLADDHLERAIAIDPTFVPAYVQLADLYRGRREEAKAEAILRRAVARNPDAALAHYALGLSLVRQRRLDAALSEIARAAELESDNAHYGYVHAVALDQAGRQREALKELDRVLAASPYDLEALNAAAIWALRRQDRAAALDYLSRLQTLRPDDPAINRELQRLRSPRRP